jgi:hypothetical protein
MSELPNHLWLQEKDDHVPDAERQRDKHQALDPSIQ